MSSLNSSTSSKKEDGLRRDRESQDLNDSDEEEEEEEGDLLEDDSDVRGARDISEESHVSQDLHITRTDPVVRR